MDVLAREMINCAASPLCKSGMENRRRRKARAMSWQMSLCVSSNIALVLSGGGVWGRAAPALSTDAGWGVPVVTLVIGGISS